MFEKSLLWAVSTLGIDQVKSLSALLTLERQANPTAQAFHAGPATDAAYADLPITVHENIAYIRLSGIMLKSYPWQSSYVSSSFHVALAIKAARNDQQIEHIVILADTPGGDVRGMHELGDEVRLAAQQKNVVVQVNGILASAGYHIATGASAVYASHKMNTIGSIGVRTAIWDDSEFYEKAGVKVIKIDTGEHKSTGMEGVPVSDEQIAEVQRIVDEMYQEFLAVIKAGRGLTDEETKAVADGRVWHAEDAVKLKLIDGIQSLETTIAALTKPKPAARLTKAAASKLFSKFSEYEEN